MPLATKAGAGKLDVPSGALANVSKLNWLTADATSHDSGIEVDVHASTVTPIPSGSGSTLSGEIPGGVLAAAAFDSSGSLSKLSSGALAQPSNAAIQTQVQKTLGVSLQDIVQAVNGPGILYLKAGAAAAGGHDRDQACRRAEGATDRRNADREAGQDRQADVRHRRTA